MNKSLMRIVHVTLLGFIYSTSSLYKRRRVYIRGDVLYNKCLDAMNVRFVV
jgi:hypothetical protein